jgi:hypothetical protein
MALDLFFFLTSLANYFPLPPLLYHEVHELGNLVALLFNYRGRGHQQTIPAPRGI